MIYLHDSPVKSHGNLKASNCLIDSRWVLKVADFGLHEFKSGAERISNNVDDDYCDDYMHGNSSHSFTLAWTNIWQPTPGTLGHFFLKQFLKQKQCHVCFIFIFFLPTSFCVCVLTSPASRLAGLLYRSPELLRLADPPLQGTQKGDIYSFGILLYAIHGRQGPFGFTPLSTSDILKKVTEHAPPLPPFRSCCFSFFFLLFIFRRR